MILWSQHSHSFTADHSTSIQASKVVWHQEQFLVLFPPPPPSFFSFFFFLFFSLQYWSILGMGTEACWQAFTDPLPPDSLEDLWDPKAWWSCLLFSVSWHWGRTVQKKHWAHTTSLVYYTDQTVKMEQFHQPMTLWKPEGIIRHLMPEHHESLCIHPVTPYLQWSLLSNTTFRKAFNFRDEEFNFFFSSMLKQLCLFAPIPTH